MRWIESNGGPLIALPASALDDWGGSTQSSSSDYERACAIDDYLGILQVGSSQALVLGDEPLRTTWIDEPGGGLLARWVFASSDSAAAERLASIPSDLDWTSAVEWTVDATPVVLFDSAEPGVERLSPRLTLPLAVKRYRVETTRYEPDNETQFLLHRIRVTDSMRADG